MCFWKDSKDESLKGVNIHVVYKWVFLFSSEAACEPDHIHFPGLSQPSVWERVNQKTAF